MDLQTDYRALREAAGVVDRSSRGRITVAGADRRSYLQGLLSNDIAALVEGSGCYATYLTAQGRMIADMRVFDTGRSLLVDVDGTLAESIAARWSQFVFSEDVQISNDSTSTAEMGVYGPASARVVASVIAAEDQAKAGSIEETLRALPLYANRSARRVRRSSSSPVMRSALAASISSCRPMPTAIFSNNCDDRVEFQLEMPQWRSAGLKVEGPCSAST